MLYELNLSSMNKELILETLKQAISTSGKAFCSTFHWFTATQFKLCNPKETVLTFEQVRRPADFPLVPNECWAIVKLKEVRVSAGKLLLRYLWTKRMFWSSTESKNFKILSWKKRGEEEHLRSLKVMSLRAIFWSVNENPMSHRIIT